MTQVEFFGAGSKLLVGRVVDTSVGWIGKKPIDEVQAEILQVTLPKHPNPDPRKQGSSMCRSTSEDALCRRIEDVGDDLCPQVAGRATTDQPHGVAAVPGPICRLGGVEEGKDHSLHRCPRQVGISMPLRDARVLAPHIRIPLR